MTDYSHPHFLLQGANLNAFYTAGSWRTPEGLSPAACALGHPLRPLSSLSLGSPPKLTSCLHTLVSGCLGEVGREAPSVLGHW